jgi:hypothetical protein
MERAVWTDQRLDDLAARVDAGFARVDADVRELRQTMIQLVGASIATSLIGFLGVIATILVAG